MTRAEVFQELILKVLGKEVELQEVRKGDIQRALEKEQGEASIRADERDRRLVL